MNVQEAKKYYTYQTRMQLLLKGYYHNIHIGEESIAEGYKARMIKLTKVYWAPRLFELSENQDNTYTPSMEQFRWISYTETMMLRFTADLLEFSDYPEEKIPETDDDAIAVIIS